MSLPTPATTALGVVHLPERNALRLVLRDPAPEATEERLLPAVIDVGEAGRLLDVELHIGDDRENADAGGRYVAVEPSADLHARSVLSTVRVFTDGTGTLVAVEIPRRGAGYEIAYPSGNR